MDGDKPLNDPEKAEVIPPEPDARDADDARRVPKLSTLGQIRAEMALTYRMALRKKIPPEVSRGRIWELRQMVEAVRVEHEFNLQSVDPDEDRPVFTGLTLIGPKALPAPVEATKRKNGKDQR